MSETIYKNENSGSQSVHFIRSFVSKLLPQKILLLLLIIFSIFSSYSIAGIQVRQDIPRMVQRTDLIIRGKVISTESQWKEDFRGRHIYTSVTLKILDKIKGNIKDGAFVFEVVGGTVDDIREVVSDTPAFEVDEDAILFLAGDPLAIQHGINGKILIYDGRVYLDGSEATADSFIQTLKILGQDPNAQTSLEGKYPAPTEGIEVEQCYIYNGQKWFGTSPTVCYYINENTSDCSGEGAAVQRGADTWNDAGADFTFQYCGSCSSTSYGQNGINCIMWGTTSGSLATAYRWYWEPSYEIFECDIVFNDNYTWSTDPDTPFGEYDVESVGVHELGHWLSLADLYDSDDDDKVMYYQLGSGDEMRTLHSCDKDGICYIYGGCPSCSITVTSPDGDCWEVGEVYNINWVSEITSGNVKIDLYQGGSLDRVIALSTPDSGTYAWSVPVDGSLTGDCDYRIRITDVSDSSCNDYSAYFCIDTGAPVLHAEPNTSPGLSNTIWWDAVPNATWYYAECANDADFANTVIGSGWISDTNCTFTGLDLEHKYWYRVKAAPRIESWSQTSQAEFQTDTLVDARATNGGDVVLAGGSVILFEDNFEDADMIGWTPGAGSYTREVTNATAAAGSMFSITLIGGSNSYHDGVSHDLTAITPDNITFYVRSSDTSKSDGHFVVGTGTGFDTQTSVFFVTTDNGQMGVYDGTTFWGTTYSNLSWYKIRFAFYWGSKEIDYYVNDSLVKSGITFRSTSVSSLTKVYLYNYHNSQAWWDEIEFSTGSGGGYTPIGDIVSTTIELPANGNWGWDVVDFNATMPANTSLTLDVLDASDDSVILADVNSSTDINWTAATELKLRANLSTDDPDHTPSLHDWSVSYAGPCESSWSNVESSLQCDTLCDFDNNYEINFADFAILAGQWQQEPNSPSADIAPEVLDNLVDKLDLAVFVEKWLFDITCTEQN